MKIQWWHIGLLIALILSLLSPLASAFPDGLDKTAEDHGFVDKALDSSFQLIPDYSFPGIQNEAVATITAGIIGTLLVFGLALGIAGLIKPKKGNEA